MDCKKQRSRYEYNDGIMNYNYDWNPFVKGEWNYLIANQLCFLTGTDGYTPEVSPPPWAKKIIKNSELKKIIKQNKSGNVNCDSPVWKNKPRCN